MQYSVYCLSVENRDTGSISIKIFVKRDTKKILQKDTNAIINVVLLTQNVFIPSIQLTG